MATPDLKRGSRRLGLLERTITRLLMRSARVTGVSKLSDAFLLTDFQGEALKDVSWQPGDKVQVKLDIGLTTRTYTPITWNPIEGTTQFLAYCHGGGPGSEWARHAAVGDEWQLFGPRSSLELADIAAPTILFGDETSFALAAALERDKPSSERRFVFEVTDREESASVLDGLDLRQAILVQRRSNDAHLQEISDIVLALTQSTTIFILSGKASSIQHLRRTLKASGIEARRLRTKVYWALGKVGLD
jgi:NADPH-dependent ferric siderophore reductase